MDHNYSTRCQGSKKIPLISEALRSALFISLSAFFPLRHRCRVHVVVFSLLHEIPGEPPEPSCCFWRVWGYSFRPIHVASYRHNLDVARVRKRARRGACGSATDPAAFSEGVRPRHAATFRPRALPGGHLRAAGCARRGAPASGMTRLPPAVAFWFATAQGPARGWGVALPRAVVRSGCTGTLRMQKRYLYLFYNDEQLVSTPRDFLMRPESFCS